MNRKTHFTLLLLLVILSTFSAPALIAAQEPVILRYPITSDPASLEPGLANELITGLIADSLHAGLFRFDSETQLTPYVAESYEVSDDGTVYTFHLNPAATWHNGSPVTAADFKAGWERYLDPDVGAQSAGAPFFPIVGAQALWDGTADTLEGVEVLDDQTLQVTLTAPSTNFLNSLATTTSWVVPAEAVVEGAPNWVDQPVGAGPFKFVEWTPNVRVLLEANDDFFLGRPLIDGIEFVVVPDAATALAQFEAGELDAVAVPAGDLERIQNDPTLSEQLQYYTRAQLQYLGFNQSQFEPFQDVRVRQAFSHAIDREVLTTQILNGTWLTAQGLVPPNIPEHNPDLLGYTYDPARAQELLAEAGYPNGEGFPALELVGLDTTLAEAVGAFLNSNLGIEVSIVTPERGDLIDGLWAHDRWQIFLFGWTADRPSASVWTEELLYSGLGSNFSTYSNPDFDALVDQAVNTLDAEEAKTYWQQAEALALEDAAILPLGYSRYIYLVNPSLSGFSINLFGRVPFAQISVSS